MPRSTLENDLMRNAHDRLITWRKDTVMRCEAVDLPMDTQISMVFTCLTGELVNLAIVLQIGEADFARIMMHAIKTYKQMMEVNNNFTEDEKGA